jgi:hypothetical protein
MGFLYFFNLILVFQHVGKLFGCCCIIMVIRFLAYYLAKTKEVSHCLIIQQNINKICNTRIYTSKNVNNTIWSSRFKIQRMSLLILTLNRLKTLHGEALDIGSNFHKVVLRRRKEAHIISKQDTETWVLWILHSRDVEAKIECLQLLLRCSCHCWILRQQSLLESRDNRVVSCRNPVCESGAWVYHRSAIAQQIENRAPSPFRWALPDHRAPLPFRWALPDHPTPPPFC